MSEQKSEIVPAKRALNKLSSRARARVLKGETVEIPALLQEFGAEAVLAMAELLEFGEPSEQADAARVLLASLAKFQPVGGAPGTPADPNLTHEQRVMVLRKHLASPDAELAEALDAELPGWREIAAGRGTP